MGLETGTLGHLTARLSQLSSEPKGCNHYITNDFYPFLLILLILSLPLPFLAHLRSPPSTLILTCCCQPCLDQCPSTPSTATESLQSQLPCPCLLIHSHFLFLSLLSCLPHCLLPLLCPQISSPPLAFSLTVSLLPHLLPLKPCIAVPSYCH